jgi:hypothetical protein
MGLRGRGIREISRCVAALDKDGRARAWTELELVPVLRKAGLTKWPWLHIVPPGWCKVAKKGK